MQFLITGVNGTLGSRVARMLAERGHHVHGADFEATSIAGVDCVAADMADYDTCMRLGKGMDAILHLGAFHGAHLERNRPEDGRTEKEFFDANIAGTFNMLRSAVENNVDKVVWASSVVVYERGHWSHFGIYSLSKVVGEEMCQFFNHEHHLRVIGLRLGTFDSDDIVAKGWGMLTDRIAVEDVTGITVAAAENESINFGFYDVQTPLPFTPRDRWRYQRNQKAQVLAEHFPQHEALLRRHEHEMPERMRYVDVHRTLMDLDYTFERDMGWFLDELARREGDSN